MTEFKYNDEYLLYWTEAIINDNHCIVIFYEDVVYNKKVDKYVTVYSVGFVVGESEQECISYILGQINYAQRNKIGNGNDLDYLNYAYKVVQEFESFIKTKINIDENAIIVVKAEDERRYRVYEHWLQRVGYKQDRMSDKSWRTNDYLYKIINGDEDITKGLYLQI